MCFSLQLRSRDVTVENGKNKQKPTTGYSWNIPAEKHDDVTVCHAGKPR